MKLCQWVGVLAAIVAPFAVLAVLIMIGWALSMIPKEVFEIGQIIAIILVFGIMIFGSGYVAYATVVEWCQQRKGGVK